MVIAGIGMVWHVGRDHGYNESWYACVNLGHGSKPEGCGLGIGSAVRSANSCRGLLIFTDTTRGTIFTGAPHIPWSLDSAARIRSWILCKSCVLVLCEHQC